MVDKPTPIDKSEYEAINNALDSVYGQLEWWRRYLGFDGNIHRIYYHGGDRIEELIARLRGEIAFLAKQLENVNDEVGDLQDKFNELLVTIDQIVQGEFEKARPGIINDVVDRVNSELSGIAAEIEGGQPLLNQVSYHEHKTDIQDVTGTAQFMVQPKLVRNSVMQSIWRNPSTGDWFITQSDGQSPEGFVMTRTDAHGNYLSNMWYTGAGHGTQILFIDNGLQNPVFYIGLNHVYYRSQYDDNKTIDISTLTETMTTPPHENGLIAWSGETDGVFAQIVGEPTTQIFIKVYAAHLDIETQTFSFSGEIASIDAGQYIDNNRQILQGLSIARKSDITGVDVVTDDSLYNIQLGVGLANTSAMMHIFEYNHLTNLISYTSTIDRLDRPMIPYRALGSNSWLGGYELEGLANIRLSSPNAKSETASGIAYGISTGIVGQRNHYIFSFNNILNFATTTAANLGAASQTLTLFNTEQYTDMWRMSKPGVYELTGADFAKFTDTPYMWRGPERIGTSAPWTLEVLPQNQNGDFIQRLTRRSGVNIVKYERYIDYSATTGWGATYLPSSVGRWNSISTASSGTARISSWVTSINELLESGSYTYLTSSELQTIAPDVYAAYPNKGMWLSVGRTSSSGDGDTRQLIQTLLFNNSNANNPYQISRTVTYNIDEFGNGGMFISATGWGEVSQGSIGNWQTLTNPTGVIGNIYFKNNGGTVEVKGSGITGVSGTGAGNYFIQLPDGNYPSNGSWGHQVLATIGSSLYWLPVTLQPRTGKLYIPNAMGQTISTETALAFSIKINV